MDVLLLEIINICSETAHRLNSVFYDANEDSIGADFRYRHPRRLRYYDNKSASRMEVVNREVSPGITPRRPRVGRNFIQQSRAASHDLS